MFVIDMRRKAGDTLWKDSNTENTSIIKYVLSPGE